MKIHAIACVSASDVFWGCEEAFKWFVEATDCTFGDANFTLITTEKLSKLCEDAMEVYRNEIYDQAKIVIERLDNLPTGVLIDLEN